MYFQWKLGIVSVFLLKVLVAAENDYPEYIIEDNCLKSNGSLVLNANKFQAGILKATSSPPYKFEGDCTIDIVPPENHGIVLSVRKVDMRQRGLFCQDFIKIFHSDVTSSPRMMCRFKFDLKGKINFYTPGPMAIVFHAEPTVPWRMAYEEGFELVYTVVSRDPQDCKANNMFKCKNKWCIPSYLKCDGYNNCGDRSEETHKLCDFVDIPSFQPVDASYVLLFCVFIFSVCGTYTIARRRRALLQSQLQNSFTSSDPFPKGLSPPNDFPPPPPPYTPTTQQTPPPPYTQ